MQSCVFYEVEPGPGERATVLPNLYKLPIHDAKSLFGYLLLADKQWKRAENGKLAVEFRSRSALSRYLVAIS